VSEPAAQGKAAGLTGRTVSSLRWSYLSSGINAAVQLAVTAILARLLYPSAFGVVAMASVILSFGQYFAQMGVGRALVQRPHIERGDIRVAFTSSVLLGAAFSALFWLAAPLSIYLFHDAEVVPVLRVSSFSFFITGLATTAMALLQREMRFRAVAVVEVASYVLAYAPLAIALAYAGYGAWSIVAASLGQLALAAGLAYSFSHHNVRPSLDSAKLRALYSFGARVSGISFLEFLGTSISPLWIGNRLGASALGIYNRAFNLINVPSYYFSFSLSRVMYSAMSRVQDETAKLRETYLAVTTVFAVLLMPVCWGAAGASQQIILVLLGPRWTEAIPVFTVLAVAAPFSVMSHFSGVLSEVTASLNPKLVLNLGRLIALAVLLVAMTPWGLAGFALAYAITEVLVYAAYYPLMNTVLGTTVRTQLRSQAAGYVAGALMLTYVAAVGWLGTASGLPPWLILLMQVSTGLLGLAWVFLRGFSGSVWAALRSGLRRSAGVQPSTRTERLLLWLDSLAATPRDETA
jgi:lipopolysaccharide exporter